MKDIEIRVTAKEIRELLFRKLNSEGVIAGKIYRELMNNSHDELKDEYIKLAREIMKEEILTLVKDYYSFQNIAKQVEGVIKKMTRKDVIKLLASTDNE